MRSLAVVALWTALLLYPTEPSAGGNGDVKLALHAVANAKALGKCYAPYSPFGDPRFPCEDFKVNVSGLFGPAASVSEIYIYMVVAKGDLALGFAGISCGIEHLRLTGDYTVNWQFCSDLEFPSGGWPSSGGGNRITWASGVCGEDQRTDLGDGTAAALAGVFTLETGALYYGESSHAGFIRITKNRHVPTPELAVSDCQILEWPIDTTRVAWVGINPDVNNPIFPGCNPCLAPCTEGPVPVRPATWGRIKSHY